MSADAERLSDLELAGFAVCDHDAPCALSLAARELTRLRGVVAAVRAAPVTYFDDPVNQRILRFIKADYIDAALGEAPTDGD